jgi:hypothetical protein
MGVCDRFAAGGVDRGDQLPPGLPPTLGVAARRQRLAHLGEDHATAHLRRDLLQIGDSPAGIGEARGFDGGHWFKIASVTLEQSSWLTVVIVCGIAVVLLAIGGYTGYSIVVGAVGLAAAVNLV